MASLKKTLLKQSKEIEKATIYASEGIADWQKIKLFLQRRISEIKLNERQKLKLNKYQFIYDQLASGQYAESQVVNLLNNKYNQKVTQSYEDISHAKEIFAQVLRLDKAFELSIELSVVRSLRRKCIAASDFKNAAMLSKVISELIRTMPAVEAEDNDFEPHEYEVTYDPESLGGEHINLIEVIDYINKNRPGTLNTKFIEELTAE